jgi:Flp pilus assembly protein TadD
MSSHVRGQHNRELAGHPTRRHPASGKYNPAPMARARKRQRSPLDLARGGPHSSARGEPAASIWTTLWWPILVIVVAGSLAYSNSLAGPFVFDDELSILENLSIRELWHLGRVLAPERELPVAGRPLVNLSFALNYAAGGYSVAGYHLVNVALHLACALLVFGAVRRTLVRTRLADRVSWPPMYLAFAASLLWTLHPLNTEAVNYVTQRTELMMAAFYLLTLYAAIRAAAAPKAGGWNALAVLSCAAGMACKESMVTAPVILVLYDRVFLFDSFRDALRSRWRLYVGLALSWIVLAALLSSGPRIHSAGFSSGVGVWTYLLNQTVMIAGYLGHAVWPRALVFNYGWPAPLTLADVLPYAVLVAALLATTVFALVRYPPWGFLGAWFFVTLAPTSSVVPIATEVGADRRMYLPLIALVVLAAIGVSLVERFWSRRGAVALLAACAVALGAATLARNREYGSALLLATTVVDRHPTSNAQHALGVELIKVGRKDEGIAHLRQAIPGASRAHYALGVELFQQGRTTEAIDELRTFVDLEPLLLEAVSARQLLGQAFAKQQQWPEAIAEYRTLLTMNPSLEERLTTEVLLGEAFQRHEEYSEAVAHYSQYLQVRPNDAAVLTSLGISLVGAGRPAEAVAAFQRAAAANPNDGGGQRNLANALIDNRDAAQALVHAERAVALRPNDPGAHDVLGRALALEGRMPEARTAFLRALQLAPDDPEARDNLAALDRLIPSR